MTPFYPTTQKPKNVEPRRKITVTMIRQRPQAQQARRHGHPLHPLQHEQQQQQKQQNHQQNHEQNQQQHPQQQYSEGQDTQKVYWQDDNDDHHVVVNMRDYEQRQRRITTRPQSPPTMIPDKDYKYFLAGTTRPRTTAMCTPHGVAKGCSYISLVGMIFLVRFSHYYIIQNNLLAILFLLSHGRLVLTSPQTIIAMGTHVDRTATHIHTGNCTQEYCIYISRLQTPITSSFSISVFPVPHTRGLHGAGAVISRD